MISRRRRSLLASSVGLTKAEMALGLSLGRALIQLKNCSEIHAAAIEELLREGRCVATPWIEHPISKEVYRTITKKPLPPGAVVRKDIEQ